MVVYKTTPSGALLAGGSPIANFSPQLIGIYRDAFAGGTGPPLALEVRFNLECRPSEYTAIIPYQSLDKFDFETEFLGCICSDSKGRSTQKQLARYIRLQLTNMSEAEMRGMYFTVSGWYDLPSGLRYIAGNQVVGEKINQPFIISPAVSTVTLVSDANQPVPNATETLVQIFRRAPGILLPVWAFTTYASLRSILRKEGMPTACVLYLDGNQGFGKSETAKKILPERMEIKERMLIMQQQWGKQINDGEAANSEHRY